MVFVCRECGAEISVDEDMRETLVENGCVICTASVSTEDFENAR